MWFLWLVLLLMGAALARIQLKPEIERNFSGWGTVLVFFLGAVLALVWFLFLSRFPAKWRWWTGGVVLVGIVGFKIMVRVDGTADGRGMPNFVWRWTPESDGGHNAALAQATTSAVVTNVPTPPMALDTPQFMGPERNGVWPDPGLDPDWAAHPPRQLWRQPTGSGWSSFAVVGGRAYTQEQRGNQEMVSCYELLTGKLLWSHANQARFYQWQGGEGPRATPTVSGGHVFAYGATGILNCLDAINGQLLWSHSVLEENHLRNIEWGLSCSPLVYDDKVVVTGGGRMSTGGDADQAPLGPVMYAFERTTGKLLWKSDDAQATYDSPILATVAGRRVIACVNAFPFTLYDAGTGEVLASYHWSDAKWPRAAQPTVLDGDRIFLTAGYGIGCVMLHFSADAAGKLQIDEVWKNNKLKAQFNSVAVRDGNLYGLDDGMFACVDGATGQRKWKEGRYGSGQSILVGHYAVVQSEPGALALLEVGPDSGKELSQVPALSCKTWNFPTLAGRYLLTRNDREVVCYELATKPTTAKR